MTTVIYLDVDGVINSLSKSAPKQNTQWFGEWKQEIVQVHSGKYPILWSTELVKSLNEIVARPDVQLVWLTTWQDYAVSVLSPLIGLDVTGSEVLYPEDQEDMYDAQYWWKLQVIKKDVETRKPEKFIWIDDDFGFERAATMWVHSVEATVLPISPYSIYGITKKNISAIIEFINE